MGFIDRSCSAETRLKYPQLYRTSQEGQLFSTKVSTPSCTGPRRRVSCSVPRSVPQLYRTSQEGQLFSTKVSTPSCTGPRRRVSCSVPRSVPPAVPDLAGGSAVQYQGQYPQLYRTSQEGQLFSTKVSTRSCTGPRRRVSCSVPRSVPAAVPDLAGGSAVQYQGQYPQLYRASQEGQLFSTKVSTAAVPDLAGGTAVQYQGQYPQLYRASQEGQLFSTKVSTRSCTGPRRRVSCSVPRSVPAAVPGLAGGSAVQYQGQYPQLYRTSQEGQLFSTRVSTGSPTPGTGLGRGEVGVIIVGSPPTCVMRILCDILSWLVACLVQGCYNN